MTAELAATRTANAAALADYQRQVLDYIAGSTAEQPDGWTWAQRLATELGSVLDQLELEKPDPATGQLAAIRALFDVFDCNTDDPQFALEQIELIVAGRDQ